MCVARLGASLLCTGNRKKETRQQQQRHKLTRTYIYTCAEINTMRLGARLSPDGRKDLTHTHKQCRHRDGASVRSTRASHETEAASRVCGKTTKRERENTLVEPSRHSCYAQASQRDPTQEHNKREREREYVRSAARRPSLMYRKQYNKEADAPTTTETLTHVNLHIYMCRNQYNAASSRT